MPQKPESRACKCLISRRRVVGLMPAMIVLMETTKRTLASLPAARLANLVEWIRSHGYSVVDNGNGSLTLSSEDTTDVVGTLEDVRSWMGY